jgi:hypothetical protein
MHYLLAGFKPGTRLAMEFWTYPLDYAEKGVKSDGYCTSCWTK